MATGRTYSADEIGILRLNKDPKNELLAGDVGYIISGIKEAKEVKVGDTITSVENPALKALAGF